MAERSPRSKRQKVDVDLTGDGDDGSDVGPDPTPFVHGFDLSSSASVKALIALSPEEAAAANVFKLSTLARALLAAADAGSVFDEVRDVHYIPGNPHARLAPQGARTWHSTPPFPFLTRSAD